MKISQAFMISLMALWIASCGSSDEGGNSAKEFSQNVDLVPYDIGRLEISGLLGSAKRSDAERLQKIIGEAGQAKDSIKRVIKGPAFELVINEKESSLQVSSAGNIDHKQVVSENTPGCSLTGTSEVSGVSTSLRIELNWNLQANLNGDGCDDNMIAKYYKFQDDEIDVFHLEAVRALLTSADLKHDAQRSIRLQLRLTGDSH